MNYQEMLAPVDPRFDIDEALESWRCLVPEPVRLLVMTAFGDLLLSAPDGGVFFLDTAAGSCERVAESQSGWEEQLGNPDQFEHWFMPSLLGELLARGHRLNPGQCFTAKHAICLGGKFEPENFEPGFWCVHLHILGQLHEQVKDLPDGTKITKINFTPL